jgi:UDP-glucose 4-epimerase
MPETVLVTGATGFIGLALVKRLAASGLKVRCLARPGADISRLALPGVEICRGDLLDAASLEAAVKGVSLVWHLGALVRPAGTLVRKNKFLKTLEAVNAVATGELAQAAAKAGVKRFIYFSSISALGPGENLQDCAEPRPLTWYGKSKLAGEAALKEASFGTALEYVILRPSMIYGPGSPGWAPLFNSVRRGALAVPGRGENRVSVCYIENLLDAALLASEKAASGAAFNISEGSLSVRELLALIGDLLEKKPALIGLPVFFLKAVSITMDGLLSLAGLYLPGFLGSDRARLYEACASWSHDSAGIRKLGWSPAVPTEKGMAAALELRP